MSSEAAEPVEGNTGVQLVRQAERTLAGAQTAGMIREQAIQTDTLWAGIARTAPSNQ